MNCSITAKEVKLFRALIFQECGINLNDSKNNLFVSRLYDVSVGRYCCGNARLRELSLKNGLTDVPDQSGSR